MKKLFSRLACVLTLGLWASAQQGPTFTIENPNQGKQPVKITRPGSAPEFAPKEKKTATKQTQSPERAAHANRAVAAHPKRATGKTAIASQGAPNSAATEVAKATAPAPPAAIPANPAPVPTRITPVPVVASVADLNQHGVGYLSTVSPTELEGRIEAALHNNPALNGTAVLVAVTDTEILLSGDVKSDKERTAAYRIASSFGGNRRVKDALTVAGRRSQVEPAPKTNSTPRIAEEKSSASGSLSPPANFKPPK